MWVKSQNGMKLVNCEAFICATSPINCAIYELYGYTSGGTMIFLGNFSDEEASKRIINALTMRAERVLLTNDKLGVFNIPII